MTHTFYNAIVFYIPFLPMVYALIGVAFSYAMTRITGSRRNNLENLLPQGRLKAAVKGRKAEPAQRHYVAARQDWK
jgi:hypothetical protein